MKTSLHLQLGHQLTMTPQLQQAIRLLLLSTADLHIEIQNALENNSMLELGDISQNEDVLEETLDAKISAAEPHPQEDSEISWEDGMGFSQNKPYYESAGNEIDTLNKAENTLQDHLTWQMQLTPFNETDCLIATVIIDSINEDGFLTCSLEEILNTITPMVDVDKSEVEMVLHRIQQFDPLGIGARTLEECLALQLAQLSAITPWIEKTKLLIANYLPLLGKRDYATLKRRLRVSADELHKIITCILQLNPKPGRLIGQDSCEYVIPDVFAFSRNHAWQVELNPLCTPPLGINSYYAAMIRRQDHSRDNQFMRDQLQQARWFIKSVQNRNETLLKVARCIVKEQEGFLTHGDEAMKPLTLHQIAVMVGMHESTISRVTTQKYMHTPRGVFELKYFFGGHITTEQGSHCSATAIRALLKKIISAENRKKPLSDSKLSKILQEQGIKVARRTIAKYREALTIPPSNERKQPQ